MAPSITNASPRQQRMLTADHKEWTVYERSPADDDRRRSPHLIFDCSSAVRRVRDYPADWLDLSASHLYAVSWGR